MFDAGLVNFVITAVAEMTAFESTSFNSYPFDATLGDMPMKTLPLLICASLLGSVTLASSVQAAPAAQVAKGDVASRVQALNALLAEQWQHTLQNSPEFATILGDLRYNDR